MVTFELNGTTPLTNRERELLEAGKKLPIVYDEDSPELTNGTGIYCRQKSETISWRALDPLCLPRNAEQGEKHGGRLPLDFGEIIGQSC